MFGYLLSSSILLHISYHWRVSLSLFRKEYRSAGAGGTVMQADPQSQILQQAASLSPADAIKLVFCHAAHIICRHFCHAAHIICRHLLLRWYLFCAINTRIKIITVVIIILYEDNNNSHHHHHHQSKTVSHPLPTLRNDLTNYLPPFTPVNYHRVTTTHTEAYRVL